MLSLDKEKKVIPSKKSWKNVTANYPQNTANLVTFTAEILNGNFFVCMQYL